MNKINELCFAGACNRGIAYIGSLKKLKELDLLDIKKMTGVSIGAFISVCYIIGYDPDEFMDYIIEKELTDFQDFTISQNNSILKGIAFNNWISEIFDKKIDNNITLKEFHEKFGIDLTILSSCIYADTDEFKQGTVYFNHKTHPDIPVITAVCASMAFPYVFPPVEYNGSKFVDGALTKNFPLDIVSSECLSFKVSTKSNKKDVSDNILTYSWRLYEVVSGMLKDIHEDPKDKKIIVINCEDFDVINFNMSIDDKITLYKRGYVAVEKYFEKISEVSEVSEVSE